MFCPKGSIKKHIAMILALALGMTSIQMPVWGEELDEVIEQDDSVVSENAISENELEQVISEDSVSDNEVAAGISGIADPRIVSDSSMEAGQKVTYDCIWLGSYPQAEVVADKSSYTAIPSDILKDGDLIEDASLYSKLQSATYNGSNETTINGTRYRRMKKDDATYAASNELGQYKWVDSTTYHYFKYEPIKWRVIEKNSDNLLLLADKAVDDKKYNETYTAVTWETCTLRTYLNSTFYDNAFTSAEKAMIKSSTVENADNLRYGTSGGNNTTDKVFLLSEKEVYKTADGKSFSDSSAKRHGFADSCDTFDEARRSQASTYARAMGTCWSASSSDKGNVYWWMRSPGFADPYATFVYSDGNVYEFGNSDCNAARPALKFNLSSLTASMYAGTVCSDGTVNETAKPGDGGESNNTSGIEFEYYGIDRQNRKYNMEYSDDYFKQYTPGFKLDLARASLCVEMAAFDKEEKHGEDGAENIKKLLSKDKLDFKDIYVDYQNPEKRVIDLDSELHEEITLPKYNSIGSVIANRKIKDENGEDCSVILVTVRGAGYGVEWGGNVFVNNDYNHAGFDLATKQVLHRLERYMRNPQAELCNNKKIWITGFSRGAATANLLAAKLDDGAIPGIGHDNVYAYCFECPKNTTEKQEVVTGHKYNNIINVINPIDVVSYVAMSGGTWNFRRYGQDYYLPSKKYNKNYSDIKEKMVSAYHNIITYDETKPFHYNDLPVKVESESELTSEIGSVASYTEMIIEKVAWRITKDEYKSYLQDHVIEMAADSLGRGKNPEIGIEFLRDIKRWLMNGNLLHDWIMGKRIEELIGEIVKILTVNTIAYRDPMKFNFDLKYHFPELALAWLEAIDEGKINNTFEDDAWTFEWIKTVATGNAIKYIVNCPVDVEVYEGDKLVANIEDNTVANIDEGYETIIDSDGQKIVYIPEGANAKIKLRATADGEMTVTEVAESIDGEALSVVSYQDVKIENGDTFTGNYDDKTEKYNLVDELSNVLTATCETKGDSIEKYTVEVESVQDDEILAIGGGEYYIGEFAEVEFVDDNNIAEFAGWYNNNDELVSKDKAYRFAVVENVSLKAKYNLVKYNTVGVENGYKLTFSKSVSYNAASHIEKSGKASASKTTDITVKVYDPNGILLSPDKYKVKFKNNRDTVAVKGKQPYFTIALKGKMDSATKAAFKATTFEFNINPCDLSTLPLTPTIKTTKNGEKIAKLTYMSDTGKKISLKPAKNGKGDYSIVAEDDETITIKGIGNYTGTVVLSK